MMKQDRLQLERFELKYIIREDVALAVRDFVASYLDIDEYGATQPNLSYPVHSLYLDSDHLTLYWQTINGNKNRYKVRIRFYENHPDAPVYFEIKRRTNNAISKQRCPVVREAVPKVLAGQMPAPSEITSDDPKHHGAIENFVRLVTECGFRPQAHVAYYREAWLNRGDNSARVTLDRQVRTEPETTARLSAQMRNPKLIFGNRVVLELKFTGLFPDWFGHLVRVFGVHQCSAAKYVDGVALLGEAQFNALPRDLQSELTQEKLLVRRSALEKNCGLDILTDRYA